MRQNYSSEACQQISWHIAVASANPAKIKAVKQCFTEVFPDKTLEVQGFAVPSGVAAQPMSSEETLLGAQNRISALKQQVQADFYVSIEAGLDGEFTFAWMLIEHQGILGKARSASLMLPRSALQMLHQGQELGDVMDQLFGTDNIKQAGGAIALLTGHRLSRSSVYQQALILALIPFLQPELYPKAP
ncbi:inosine/xanthosine triphosphatase [Rheinheimera sp. 4Y26]|uniref:inosine/xanthosine triphosphatase n=1 Tax=Rheinheimera sp. 4Y26 TaxID=2977811 RepID=UPI0021B09E57|nr:inosine/xanthosine triphosphatase [Rheinheimera sp. 4Y26]MCT6699248.1 inosine/xanthosine triphosphatase [Rheinheimera sp. 4Y26]